VYDTFREAGRNFVDTANMYTHGTSESFPGEFAGRIQIQRRMAF
jgi:aryl-alcohol dehydrogenase-like predicted oxidoreductase